MAIERVVYLECGDLNVNSQRTISTIMSGKDNEFETSLVRLIKAGKGEIIGGHYREYPEVWGFLGDGEVTLIDVGTKERKKYSVKDGSRLFIPAMVASQLKTIDEMVIVTCSPNLADREKQTHKYNFT